MLVGLVGKPSVGKSTFFRAATLAEAEIASYPFTTIKPNHAIAYVKIKDLAPEFERVSNPREGYVKSGKNEKGELVKGYWRFVPFEMADVAGLVEGASEGKGLGNQFLDDLTNADAMIMVVDVSGETDAEGKPTEDYNPGNDIRMIEDELDKWYLGILKKVWKTLARNMEVQKTEFSVAIAKQFSGLKVTEEDVKSLMIKLSNDISHPTSQLGNEKKSSGVNDNFDNIKLDFKNPSKWRDKDLMKFSRALRRYTKPMIIAANKIDRPNGKVNFEKIKKEFSYPTVSCFSEGELALKEADKAGLIDYVSGDSNFKIVGKLSDKQKQALESVRELIKENGSTGVQEVLNRIVLDVLKYICIFPAGAKMEDSKGNVLPDCYLMPPGSTALDFAFRLHTDIGKGFVKAIDIRTKKAVGKDYKLKHRDGLEILTR
jgi:ribosome-binding ATPase